MVVLYSFSSKISSPLEAVDCLSTYSVSSISTISLESNLEGEYPNSSPLYIADAVAITISSFPNSCSYTTCVTPIACAT